TKNPPTFHKNLSFSVERWLIKLDEFIHFTVEDDLTLRIIVASTYISDESQSFLQPHLSGTILINSWDEFLLAFWTAHGDQNLQSCATRDLLTLKQGNWSA